mgnify:CR=1 FL=1
MEFFTILLSSLLTVVSVGGLLTDSTAESSIRSQFQRVEQLKVRIDNAPTHQILQGKANHVRVASRGAWLTPDIRLDTLELETDPVSLDLARQSQAAGGSFRQLLEQPLQAGVRLALTEEDINRALRSPLVNEKLQEIAGKLLQLPGAQAGQSYQLVNPQVKLLAENRLRFQAQLTATNAEPLAVSLESGLNVVAGRSLQLVNPVLSINEQPIPPQLVRVLTGAIGTQFDLRSLESSGILARILKLNIDSQQIELATFVQVAPL